MSASGAFGEGKDTMSRAKAKELNANMRQAQPYVPVNMKGRVRHDVIWQRCLDRWKPGTRSFVEPASESPEAPNG